MNVALWIVQALLALMFLFHGYSMWNPPTSQANMAYIQAIPTLPRRLIGTAEVLAALGLILPGLTHILPILTPLAAVGLMIVMIGAIIFHISRNEVPNIVFNVILLTLSVFIAYGRFIIVPL